MSDKLQIGLLIPDVLGTYGDSGNAIVLRELAIRHGIDAEIVVCPLGQEIPSELDIYTLGGGEDTAQALASYHLKEYTGFKKACDKGKVVLGICASMQILGKWYTDAENRKVEGLGILDLSTSPQGHRSIGEMVSLPLIPELKQELTGFENHGGATKLQASGKGVNFAIGADAYPLGRVIYGQGNATTCENPGEYAQSQQFYKRWEKYSTLLNEQEAKYDGAVAGNVITTYMHGPCLARNSELANWILSKATGHELPQLDLDKVEQLRYERLKACGLA